MDFSVDDDVGEAVGVAFRLTRRRLGLSQRELADRLGWDRAKVGRWEAGDVPPALAAVEGVLRAMGFRLVLVDLVNPLPEHPDDAPFEHIMDRGNRRFPAHLPVVSASMRSYWWTRYFLTGDNPYALGWSYLKRPSSGPRCGGGPPG